MHKHPMAAVHLEPRQYQLTLYEFETFSFRGCSALAGHTVSILSRIEVVCPLQSSMSGYQW